MAVPIRRQPRVRILRLGSNRPKWLPMVSTAGARVSEATQRDQDADRGRNAEALEVRQPGEGQAEHRAGDRQARTEDHVRGAAVHGVEGGLPILPGRCAAS